MKLIKTPEYKTDFRLNTDISASTSKSLWNVSPITTDLLAINYYPYPDNKRGT